MSVRCLDENQKTWIASQYLGGMPTKNLAQRYLVSVRTINRVLVEMNVARTPKRKTKEQAAVATPLHIDMIELTFTEKLSCFFKAIFWRTPKQENAHTN